VLQMFFFIIPNILLIFISVVSYGPVWGSLLAWLGIFFASSVGYLIGRKLSPVLVQRLVSEKTQHKLREFISSYGMKAIIALRLSSLSNDGLSLVAGLLNMKYRRFIQATMIGITPLIAVIALFGHSGKIEKGLVFVGVFLLVCLVVYVIIDKRQVKKRQVPRSDSAG
ncbi:MAG: VTT domain-containing protein, partial [Bacteroidota bacterium]|nr:VTT domain-containing protein [Bacteroidota bacterium]